MTNAKSKWKLFGDFPLRIQQWEQEQEAVLYHEGSGDVYLISNLSKFILDQLTLSSVAIEDLLVAVKNQYTDVNDLAIEELEIILQELAARSLVEELL